MSDHVPETIRSAVDTHLHPWLLSDLPPVIQGAREVRPDLIEDFSPSKVLHTALASGFGKVILVHARDPHEGAETEAAFFIESGKESPQIAGAIVGVDLLDTKGTVAMLDRLAAFDSRKTVRSVRMIKPENAGVGILSDARTKETLTEISTRGLAFDLLLRCKNPGQLQEGVELVSWAASLPLRIVGDHLLKPLGVHEGSPSAEWCNALREMRRNNNFYLKLSGLAGETGPDVSPEKLFFPFYDTALELLGAGQLVFGSDHPVSFGHAAATTAVVSWLSQRGLLLTEVGQKILSENAHAAYNLSR